jgi:hypothetical protein
MKVEIILQNNRCHPETIYKNINTNLTTKTSKEATKKKKRTTSHFGIKTRAIAKLFKNINMKTSFRTSNRLKNLLKEKQKNS